MPRIPSVEGTARPIPQPTGNITRIGAGDADSLTAEARVTAQQGGMLMQAGDQLAARQKEFDKEVEREQLRVDTLRAEDAMTRLREKQLALSLGDGGYTKVQGTAALSRPLLKDYGDMFDQEVRGMMGELGNDQQKELFRQRAQVVNLQYREGILRHLATESKQAQKQQLEGTVAVEIKQATANWDKPDEVGFSIERVRAGINRMAEIDGWDGKYTEAKTKEVLGKIHDAVIDQMISSGQLVRAQDWYKANKDDVDVGTAKTIQAKTVDAQQREIFNGYQAGYLANQESIPGLKGILAQVSADKTLSDERKNVLVGRFQSRIEGIERKQEAAADRAERRATTELNAMITRIGQGWEPSMEQMGGLIQAAKGRPQLAGLVNDVIQTANATRVFRQADPVVQERLISEATVAVREGKIAPKLLNTFQSISEHQQKVRDADPTSYAVQQGIVGTDELAAKPIDLNKPDPNQLQARMDLGRAMAQRYRTPFKPLTEEERKLAVATLRNGGPEQRREFFKNLSLATGDDTNGYKAIMAQIAPDDPVTAVAGLFARRGMKDAQGAAVADRLLDGMAILRPNKTTDGKSGGTLLPMPKEGEMRKEWDNYARGAYAGSPSANNVTFQAAQAIYASLSKQAGDRDTSVLDAKRWTQAMQEASGGITRVNGKEVVKPWGMQDGEFADQLDTRLRMIANSGNLEQGMSLSKLRDLPLRPDKDGIYVLSIGDRALTDKTGKVITIDFNQALPANAVQSKTPTSAAEIERARLERVNRARDIRQQP